MASIKDPVNPMSGTTPDANGPGCQTRPGEIGEIEDDIHRTRAEMDRTFDALERKLAPAQLLEDGWDTVREKTAAGATRLWDLARDHPLPALTVGLGLGWLVVDAMRQAGARRARGGLRELVEERPLAVGAASLAVGLLAGLALPATRREDELLGDARDEMLESARAAGREALDKGIEVTANAVERVKESVREQELTPEQLAEKARNVAHDAAETLRDAERQVVDTLTGAGRKAPPAGFQGGAPGSAEPANATAWNPGQPASPVGTPPRL
jgi:hypothetical protein